MKKEVSNINIIFKRLKEKIIKSKIKPGSLINDFYNLGPEDDVLKDNLEVYRDAFNYATKNENIYNIAVTGPNGSGKSSIIRSYFKNIYDGHKDDYLFITMGSFKVSTELKECNQDNAFDNIYNEIEKSILKQLIYREGKRNLPNSRIRRINHTKKIYRVLINILLLYLLIRISLILDRKLNLLILSKDLSLITSLIQNWGIISVIRNFVIPILDISSFVLIINYIIRNFTSRNILSSIKVLDNEVKFDEKEQSFINMHIDEILYYFQATKTSIVIFEDLDRFKNPSIFIKLRELNSLINNNKSVKNKVKFIYAMRDDMFSSLDRVKFFDLIIPTIPVINSVNSIDKFTELFKPYIAKNDISISLKELLCSEIDDMRLLKNIINEYAIESNIIRLEGNLDKNKLLSMIVIKNIYPKEYSDLYYNKGLIFQLFKTKDKIILELTESVKKEIESLELLLEKKNERKEYDIDTLKRSYLHMILMKANNSSTRVTFYKDNFGNKMNKNTVELYNIFEFDNISTCIKININNKDYSMVEGEFSIKSVIEKINEINELAVINKKELVNEIIVMRDKISVINKSSFRDLLDMKPELISIMDMQIKNSCLQLNKMNEIDENNNDINNDLHEEISIRYKLIKMLISEGYIDELSYVFYMNHFYDEHLKNSDILFIKNVKDNKIMNYDYKIEDVNIVIDKLFARDYQKKAILNVYILNYLLKEESSSRSLTDVIKVILQNIAFFEFSIDQVENLYEYLLRINELDGNFLSEYIKSESYKMEHRMLISKYLIRLLTNKGIISITDCQVLREFIIENYKISELHKLEIDKLEDSLKLLEISFENADSFDEVNDTFIGIVKHKLFNITYEVLYCIFNKLFSISEEEFSQKNISLVFLKSEYQLNEHFAENQILYDSEILSRIKVLSESDSLIIDLLNNKEIIYELKNSIIQKSTKFKVNDITDINDNDILKIILDGDKIDINWRNIVNIYIRFNKYEYIDQFISDSLDFDMEVEMSEGLNNLIINILIDPKVGIAIKEKIINKFNFKLNDDNIQYFENEIKAIKMCIENYAISCTPELLSNILPLSIEVTDILYSKIKLEFGENIIMWILESNKFELYYNSNEVDDQFKIDIIIRKFKKDGDLPDDIHESALDLLNDNVEYVTNDLNIVKEVVMYLVKSIISKRKKYNSISNFYAVFTKEEVFELLISTDERFENKTQLTIVKSPELISLLDKMKLDNLVVRYKVVDEDKVQITYKG